MSAPTQNTAAAFLPGCGTTPAGDLPARRGLPFLGLHRCGGASPDAGRCPPARPDTRPQRRPASNLVPSRAREGREASWHKRHEGCPQGVSGKRHNPAFLSVSSLSTKLAALVVASLLAGPSSAETDACRHFEAWPVEIVSEWVGDLVCGDIEFAPKGKIQPLDPNPRLTALVARYGSGEAVRAMVQGDDRPINVIPLPGAFWLLASALAGLWAWGRRG